MSTVRIFCKAPECKRLIKNAIPAPHGIYRVTPCFNEMQYCSKDCVKLDENTSITCIAPKCSKLTLDAVPVLATTRPLNNGFDTKKYCSNDCSSVQYPEIIKPAPAEPLITCEVCTEEKTLSKFVRVDENHNFSIPFPYECRCHIAPQLVDSWDGPLGNGICIQCIGTHIRIQFQDLGAHSISCITQHEQQGWSLEDWSLYAFGFLPKSMHAKYAQWSIDTYLSRMEQWSCPNNYSSAGMLVTPKGTPGCPHVKCYTCHARFRAVCKVPWHTGLTCQQHRAKQPEVRDKQEVALLNRMAQLQARRCPRCQFIIVKDGGCDHMVCYRCHHSFSWYTAEKVQPSPGSEDDKDLDDSWSGLLQEGDLNDNTDYDEEFDDDDAADIAAAGLREVCEIDAIAAQAQRQAEQEARAAEERAKGPWLRVLHRREAQALRERRSQRIIFGEME